MLTLGSYTAVVIGRVEIFHRRYWCALLILYMGKNGISGGWRPACNYPDDCG